ncbi:MAG: hypothetical protein LVR00_01795 [Rhabdochlamydiaceae bacterium]|jgi:hypothetical protein
MTFRVEESKNMFINKLAQLEAAFAPKSGLLVDENLHVIHRGRFWWVLSLLRPFYAILGRDPYSHVRIERVVKHFFKYVEANQSFLQEDLSLVGRIQTQLLEKIETRTRKDFSFYKSATAGLGINPDPCIWPLDRDRIWEGMILPTYPQARKAFIQILEAQTRAAVLAIVNLYQLGSHGFNGNYEFVKNDDTRHVVIQPCHYPQIPRKKFNKNDK